jgi:hypothetical protein
LLADHACLKVPSPIEIIMDTTRTSSAEWPADIHAPEPVQKWLEILFPLLDSREPDAPEKVAAMYTEDAEVHSAAGVAKGTERTSSPTSFR